MEKKQDSIYDKYEKLMKYIFQEYEKRSEQCSDLTAKKSLLWQIISDAYHSDKIFRYELRYDDTGKSFSVKLWASVLELTPGITLNINI